MFDFRRIALFCLEKRLSKHKVTTFSKNFGVEHGPFGEPWLHLWRTLATPLANPGYTCGSYEWTLYLTNPANVLAS